MEERDMWYMLGGVLVVTLLFVAIEFLLPTPGTAAGLTSPWVPGSVTTAAARMTGGGSVSQDSSVTYGFQLHCDVTQRPNDFQVNWGRSNRFHLEELTMAACTDDPAIAPNPPAAGFDTHEGAGTGRYNGVSGARAEWTLTDAGEPGNNDIAEIVIRDGDGNVVLSVSGNLRGGDHQSH